MAYGDNVTGGTGGETIWINSLDPDVLLSALSGTTPRIIRFGRVRGSGFIHSDSPLIVSGAENFTIEGEDAWTFLRGDYIRFMGCSNFIINNMRFASNQQDLANGDPLMITSCSDVQINNCEFYHSNDDCTVNDSNNVRFYRCAWVEPIGSYNSPGDHAYGLFLNTPSTNVLIRESLIAFAQLRNPLVNGCITFMYINNVGYALADGINIAPSLGPIDCNVVGNVYGPNIAGTTGQWFRLGADPQFEYRAYLDDNLNGMIGNVGEFPVEESPLDPDNLPENILPASEVFNHVLNTVGAWSISTDRRHPYMERIIKRIRGGEDTYATSVTWPRDPIHLGGFSV